VVEIDFMADRVEQLKELVARQTAMIQSQMDRIGALEAEITRLNAVIASDCDALETLQKIYSDASMPISTQLKAAGIAVQFERPRPPSIDYHLHGVAERLGEARQRYLARMVEGTVDPPDAA
jgi:hypothetical protein